MRPVKIILFCSVFLAVFCWDDLTLQMEGEAQIQVSPGGTLNLTCHTNYGAHLLLMYAVEWWHKDMWGSNNTCVELPDSDQRQKRISDKGYNIKVEHLRGETRMILVVKNISAEDDGYFSCGLKPNSGVGDSINASKEVTVVNGVQSVTLTFDGAEAVTGQNNTPVQKEEGEYNITCTAEGFNPSASIRIFLGDEEQTTGDVVSTLDEVASLAAKARRYNATVTAIDVRISAGHEGTKLRCEAKANYESYLPSAELIVTSVLLHIVSQTEQDTLQSSIAETENNMALGFGVGGGLFVLVIVIVIIAIVVFVRRRAEGNTFAYLRISPSSRTDVSTDDVLDDEVTFHSKIPPQVEHNGRSADNHEARISSGS